MYHKHPTHAEIKIEESRPGTCVGGVGTAGILGSDRISPIEFSLFTSALGSVQADGVPTPLLMEPGIGDRIPDSALTSVLISTGRSPSILMSGLAAAAGLPPRLVPSEARGGLAGEREGGTESGRAGGEVSSLGLGEIVLGGNGNEFDVGSMLDGGAALAPPWVAGTPTGGWGEIRGL